MEKNTEQTDVTESVDHAEGAMHVMAIINHQLIQILVIHITMVIMLQIYSNNLNFKNPLYQLN